MRACVIFNPAAKGNKARQLRKQLDVIAAQCALKPTAAAGDARPLATAAIAEGFDHIIAAGGDGTLNEVLNGIADAPNGFERTRLGVLPLGTVNVFARELKIPLRLNAAWACIQRGHEQRIDVAYADHTHQGKSARRYFVQLAGAGLDARAIELVSWSLKKRVGPLAYIIAGLQALCEKRPAITATNGHHQEHGELILVGNGSLYGGNYEVLEGAHLSDGKLHVCVFPRVNWGTLLRCGLPLLATGRLPEKSVRRFQATEFQLTAASHVGFELEGEWVGQLPAKFGIMPGVLRVIAP